MKNQLKKLIKNRGWSQADLARALKISRQAVNVFELGKISSGLQKLEMQSPIIDYLTVEETK